MRTAAVEFDVTRFGGVGPLSHLEGQNVTGKEHSGPSGPSGPSKNPLLILEKTDELEGGVGKTIEKAGTTRTTGTTQSPLATPTFRFTAVMEFGDVCNGWTPTSWAHELRRKAECCEAHRPDIADYYRRWASTIEEKLRA